MNMEHIRQQMEDIHTPAFDVKHSVLRQIQIRSQKRKQHMKIVAVVALFFVIIGTSQYQQIVAIAENIFGNIQLSLKNETLIIDYEFEKVSIEVTDLNWLGKKKNKRAGEKTYANIHAAEEELKINVLKNTMSYEPALDRVVPFIYFEEAKIAKLFFHNYFIGDLWNYKEEILENGDQQISYSPYDHSIYQSPVSMHVTFFTESGKGYETADFELYQYEEKYTSPLNGITAYILKDTFQDASDEQRLLRYAAGDSTDKVTVFVYDNLFYTISGNIPSSEMKEIIDSFVVEK